MSPQLSPPTCRPACAPFTPSNSGQRLPPTFYRGCWHVVSRGFLLGYRHYRPRRQEFTIRKPSSSTRRRCIRVSPIVQYSPLLPPVGVWAVSQSLSPTPGQVPHVLLTRSPLSHSRVHPKTSAKITPFDLHVLGAPPAFVLSQDQTLYKMVSKPDHSEFKSLHSQTQSLASCELLFGIFKVFSTLKKGPSSSSYCSIFKVLSLKKGPSSSSYCSIFKVLLPPLSRGSLIIIAPHKGVVNTFFGFFEIL